jgi:putative endopeptidase
MVLFATVSATAGHLKDTFATPPLGDWLTRNVDTSVRAGDDFFTYANGGCLRRNPIPASESQTMIDF